MEFGWNELWRRISEIHWVPICKSIIPIVFNGANVLVHVERDNLDKVTTYLVSVLNRINPIRRTLQVIIVTGKEFSQLVYKICKDLAIYLNLTIIKPNGDFSTNVKLYYNGAQVIIGHPEEIMTLLKTSSRPISPDFKSIVIDNGEEVFLKESVQFIDEIMRRLPPNRQILLFTSDLMGSITKFKKDYLKNAAEFDFIKDLVSNGRTDKAYSNLVKKSTDVPKAANMTEKLPSQYLSFEEFGLNKDLLKRISELNRAPMCIDKVILPIVLNNENIFVLIRRRNFDKVPTYLVSVLNRINPIKKVLQVVIVTSKEFSQLVYKKCEKLGIYLNLTIIMADGDFHTNVELLHNGVQVIIGHPESIIKLLKSVSRPISSDFKSLVIDNGEEVFSKKSVQFIDEIMRRLPPNRQILLFTSDMMHSITKFKKDYLKNAAEFDFLKDLVSFAK